MENCSLVSDILKTIKVFSELFLFVSSAFGHQESLAIANEFATTVAPPNYYLHEWVLKGDIGLGVRGVCVNSFIVDEGILVKYNLPYKVEGWFIPKWSPSH